MKSIYFNIPRIISTETAAETCESLLQVTHFFCVLLKFMREQNYIVIQILPILHFNLRIEISKIFW